MNVRGTCRAAILCLLVGAFAGGIAAALLGIGRYCDRTPPCPRAAYCATMRIAGPCGVDSASLLVATAVAVVVAGTVALVLRHRRR